MRIKLRHRLTFRFADPPRTLTQLLRLTPRSHEGQRVTNWRIDVEPDGLLKAGEDHFGNITHTLTVTGRTPELRIMVQGEISNYDAVGIVRGAAERLPQDIYLRDTPLTGTDPDLRAFARDVTAGPEERIVKLHDLMGAVHSHFSDAPGVTGSTGAIASFVGSKGNAEDHAHVMIACARHMGWPARCVSGYILPEHDPPRRHAWAEVQVDGLGWVGFDAVNDVCPQDSHIRTAIGLDASDAAAIRSTRLDNLAETVEVAWMLGREASLHAQAQAQGG